jgi:hypothetical protein
METAMEIIRSAGQAEAAADLQIQQTAEKAAMAASLVVVVGEVVRQPMQSEIPVPVETVLVASL